MGFDDDGSVHLRVEHRPMAAGPTVADMMAHLAFAIGLMAWLAARPTPPELQLPFAAAQANFYAAARHGLAAPLQWLGGETLSAQALLQRLLGPAHEGLRQLGVHRPLADGWMALLEARLALGLTGARWQLMTLDALHGDLAALTLAYASRQADGAPLHTWH